MALVEVPGFTQLNTSSNERSLDKSEVSTALNMVCEGNRYKTRGGSSMYKTNAQTNWGRPARFGDFKKRADNFFYSIAVLINGRVFYIRSDDAAYGTPAATWTELNSPASTTPALSVGAERYAIFGFNNRLYFGDNSNGYFSWDGSTSDLVAETDPPNLGSNKILEFTDKSSRLTALDDGGITHLSAVNNGQDFTTISGGGFQNYGRVEGLKATNIISFGDDVIITTEDPLTLKFQTYRLLGLQFYDPTVVGSDRDKFEVRKINSIAGIVGDSAQEITDDAIGLTPRGFISINKAIDSKELTERDYISFPIKEIIREINFSRAEKITSVVDFVNGRYLCAVPYGADSLECNMILVYDFMRSSPAEGIYRWTIWTFAFQEIACLGKIQGKPYAADLNGNIYKIDDADAGNADNGLPINYVLKFAPIGGGNVGTEKAYGDLVVLFTDLATDRFDMNVNVYKDGVLVTETLEGTPITVMSIEQLLSGIRYDTGVAYDDFNYYDSGNDKRVVTFNNRGGRAESMSWSFSTNTTGVSWGVAEFSVDVEVVQGAKKSARNFAKE